MGGMWRRTGFDIVEVLADWDVVDYSAAKPFLCSFLLSSKMTIPVDFFFFL